MWHVTKLQQQQQQMMMKYIAKGQKTLLTSKLRPATEATLSKRPRSHQNWLVLVPHPRPPRMPQGNRDTPSPPSAPSLQHARHFLCSLSTFVAIKTSQLVSDSVPLVPLPFPLPFPLLLCLLLSLHLQLALNLPPCSFSCPLAPLLVYSTR